MAAMSYHCEVQRANRIENIKKEIGIGQIIKEKYHLNQKNQGSYVCITDTGITIIKSEDKQTIITMYVTTYRELVAFYGGPKKVPQFLRKRVDKNQSKFTKNQKTIW